MPSGLGVSSSGKLLKIELCWDETVAGSGMRSEKERKACRSACDEIGDFLRIRFVQECRHRAFGVAGSLVAGDRAHELSQHDRLG